MTNQIKFSTSSSLLITSYGLVSLTNFLLVSQHIFTADSRFSEGLKIGLFTGALATTAINMMILLYIKSRKMPSQGIALTPMFKKSFSFGPIIFTIFQIILLALLISLFLMSYTSVSTTTKVFIILAMVVLNMGIILMIWSFSSTHCGSFNPIQQGLQSQMVGSQYGMSSSFGAVNPMTGMPYGY
jgi:hypothetical protein